MGSALRWGVEDVRSVSWVVAFVFVTSASASAYPAAESSDVRRRRVGAP